MSSWLKTGAESAAIAKQEEQAQEIRKEEQGKMFRFFMAKGESCKITFVDGALSPEGFLLPPRYYEHNIFLNGRYGNTFVCPEKTAPHLGEACPICTTGDRPSLVSLFTVIDHREFKSQKDSNKVYKDRPKLFVAKNGTMEILNKHAVKRGGLAGATFEVSRSSKEMSPGVGDLFDFEEKAAVEELAAQPKYNIEITDATTNKKSKICLFVPANYEKEIVFRSAEQLAQLLGVGAPAVSGFKAKNTPAAEAADPDESEGPTDYSSQL